MTEFQTTLLLFITEYIRLNSCSPTMRECSSHMKCGMNKLYGNLRSLERRRKIQWFRHLWRGIELIPMKEDKHVR